MRLHRERVLNRQYTRDSEGKFASTSGGPGSGKDLIGEDNGAALARDVVAAARQRETEPGSGTGVNGDEMLNEITARQGFNDPPVTVGRQGLEELVAGGHRPLYRGVTSSGSKTEQEMIEQFRTGDAYQGFGVWGNGTYTSNQVFIARRYGVVSHMALHPDARVVTRDQLHAEHSAFMATQTPGTDTHRVFSDPGRYAAARGYDAIDVVGSLEDEVLVLNRSALAVRE